MQNQSRVSVFRWKYQEDLFRHVARLLLLIVTVFCASGCGRAGPKTSSVTGVVTIEGKPEADLQVTFEPQVPKGEKITGSAVGGISVGITDAEGKFELTYRDGKQKGAVVGPHLVKIVSAKGGGAAPENPADAEPQLVIPQEYNRRTTLKAEVNEGDNEFDFDLKGIKRPKPN